MDAMNTPYTEGLLATIAIFYLAPAAAAWVLLGLSRRYPLKEKYYWSILVLLVPLLGALAVILMVCLPRNKPK
jgi:hypothetical protein